MIYDTCTHDDAYKDAVIADGLCPVCMQAEIDRLREALAWYADNNNYETFDSELWSEFWQDNGQRARDALKGGEG